MQALTARIPCCLGCAQLCDWERVPGCGREAQVGTFGGNALCLCRTPCMNVVALCCSSRSRACRCSIAWRHGRRSAPATRKSAASRSRPTTSASTTWDDAVSALLRWLLSPCPASNHDEPCAARAARADTSARPLTSRATGHGQHIILACILQACKREMERRGGVCDETQSAVLPLHTDELVMCSHRKC